MKILALDTSTSHAALGISDGPRVLAELALDAGKNRGESLAPALSGLLGPLGLKPAEIDAYAVGLGPGSFTGLRTGIAFVIGLALANPRPVIGVSTLHALALNAPFFPGTILPLIDAKKGQLFAARFRGGGDTLVPHNPADKRVGPTPDIIRETPDQLILPDAVPALIDGPTLILGDGLRRYDAIIRAQSGPHARFAPESLFPPRASSLASLALPRLLLGQSDPLDSLVPIYLRSSDTDLGLAPKSN
jgi:tRNA threonylcarbamoyladenosine biosynthesis protein TsaB